MRQLLPEDKLLFIKDFPEAVEFLKAAHRRYREHAKALKEKQKADEADYLKNFFATSRKTK